MNGAANYCRLRYKKGVGVRRTQLMAASIEFTDAYAWDPDRQCLSFEVLVDGTRARCLMSWEILVTHFGAPSPDVVPEIFDLNRVTIKDMAEVLLEAQGLDENGELYIRAEDIV